MKTHSNISPTIQHLVIDQHEIDVHIRKHPRARRMTLRYNPIARNLVLTLPRRASLKDGERFLKERHNWIRKVLEGEGTPVRFEHGVTIPLLGTPHLIHHTQERRGVVRVEDGKLHVSGAKEHLPRRVSDWLKEHVRQQLYTLAHEKAAQLGKQVKRVSVRESRSRWGSCSSKGYLSFSWRLVFAPFFVMDYIVAHEVAHLVEMNHSKRFWRTVETICPAWEEAERWLKKNSAELYRYAT